MLAKTLVASVVLALAVCNQSSAQSSMAGKTCLGSFEITNANPNNKWNMGAVRVAFTSATAGTLQFADGFPAYQHPERMQKFDTNVAFSDATFDGTRLKFSGGSSKMDLTGDGTTFSGINDPRPRLPLTGNIKMSCK
jgi:hypothetical protein